MKKVLFTIKQYGISQWERLKEIYDIEDLPSANSSQNETDLSEYLEDLKSFVKEAKCKLEQSKNMNQCTCNH